jgi:hypothetical protein
MQLINFCNALYSLHICGVNTVQLVLQVHATLTVKLIVFSCIGTFLCFVCTNKLQTLPFKLFRVKLFHLQTVNSWYLIIWGCITNSKAQNRTWSIAKFKPFAVFH